MADAAREERHLVRVERAGAILVGFAEDDAEDAAGDIQAVTTCGGVKLKVPSG
jgi:hypothetical protein